MMATSEVRRILVALDDSAPSQAALQAAASLAARLDAELAGLFVQDVELLRLARLPLAREVGLASASRREFDSARVERGWRAQAARAKAALDAAALRHRLRTSFHIARGDVIAELLHAATDADVLAMGTMGHMGVTGRRIGSTLRGVTAEARCSLLLLRHMAVDGNRIVVHYGDSEAAERALVWAELLARAQHCQLSVIVTDDVPEATRQRAAVRIEALPEAALKIVSPNQLEASLRGADCQLLIVPCDSPVFDDGDELLAGVRSPMLVVR